MAAFGHDRITQLAGAGCALPISVLAFVCGGCALIGLPFGGAFLAKSLLLGSPAASEQWWWDWIMFAGSMLTSAYVIVVMRRTLTPARMTPAACVSVPRYQQMAALMLALSSLLLSLAVFGVLGIMQIQIGRPDAAYVVAVAPQLSDVFSIAAMLKAFGPVVLGTALAIGHMWQERARAITADEAACSGKRSHARLALLDQADHALRQWSVGSTSLLFLAIAFGAAMFAAH